MSAWSNVGCTSPLRDSDQAAGFMLVGACGCDKRFAINVRGAGGFLYEEALVVAHAVGSGDHPELSLRKIRASEISQGHQWAHRAGRQLLGCVPNPRLRAWIFKAIVVVFRNQIGDRAAQIEEETIADFASCQECVLLPQANTAVDRSRAGARILHEIQKSNSCPRLLPSYR